MKTLELFNKYTDLLIEADELQADELDATDISEQPPIQPPTRMTSEGERFNVEVLLKAFLHEPDESDNSIALQLQDDLKDATAEDVKNMMADIIALLKTGPNDTKSVLDDTQV
jgi:hypothetical protein